MSGYGEFADVYDLLTENVPYDDIAEYYHGIIGELGAPGKYLLDMGCGTGNLTMRLAALGYDIIASDASQEMLTVAVSKLCDENIRYICQSMTETELYGAVDIAVSTLDSINHLDSAEDILACFRQTAQNMNEDGLFLFDVNTVFKHREILADNTFVYDVDGVYCVWQNEFCKEDNSVGIELDLFYENEDGSYDRGFESFREIALPKDHISELLSEAGFEVEAVYEYLTHNAPCETSDKLLFAARKK
ncbi:MAG: class I SAM-dependent methyltransferase [Oscillospiraceae bacterium]|nr:class I SAM-dependent methyltransferase [Oscillospiraceae bacterium]